MGQLFEAIVTDAAPDADLPGFIKVKIPELFGDVEVPYLVGPVHPGWTAGGWQSVPAAELPDSESDETDVRVLVVQMSPYVFRYIGTTQGWSTIEESPGTVCGVRSPDGKHSILMDADGVRVTGFEEDHSVEITSDGIVITSDMTKIGSSSASQFAAMSNLVDSAFSTLRTELLSHTHPVAGVTPGPGAVVSGPPVGIGGSSESTACTKVKIE